MVELHKRPALSDVSVQELGTELKRVNVQLVQVTSERVELPVKLGTVTVESDKRLEDLTAGLGARDHVKRLVRCNVSQSVEALEAFVNQIGTQLVDRFLNGL